MAKAARFATSPRQSQASELILSKVIADHVDYARLISASVELKSVRNQIRKHLGNFFCYLLQSQFSYVSWKDQTETNKQVKNSHDNF